MLMDENSWTRLFVRRNTLRSRLNDSRRRQHLAFGSGWKNIKCRTNRRHQSRSISLRLELHLSTLAHFSVFGVTGWRPIVELQGGEAHNAGRGSAGSSCSVTDPLIAKELESSRHFPRRQSALSLRLIHGIIPICLALRMALLTKR